jgi:hypothetical protein
MIEVCLQFPVLTAAEGADQECVGESDTPRDTHTHYSADCRVHCQCRIASVEVSSVVASKWIEAALTSSRVSTACENSKLLG